MEGNSENPHEIQSKQRQTAIERIEKLHPYQLILYLSLMGSGIIFLFLIIANFATRPADLTSENFILPKQFIVSTIVILSTSFVLNNTYRLFEEEKMKALRNNIGLAIILGLVFAISQYVGWFAMIDQGILFEGRTGGVYLYILSGLHLIHLIGGIIFLLIVFVEVVKISRDPIKSLIATTNPYQKLKIKIMVSFWHYLDVTWVIVFFYFLFSY